MTPSNPRRPRSPGRRQFSPGTDQEWEQALQTPAVQRALQDPQTRQALSQMMSQQLGPPPQRFAEGGQSGGLPDPATVERMQQLEDEIKSESEPTRYQWGGQAEPTDPTLRVQWLQSQINNPNLSYQQRQQYQDELTGIRSRQSSLTGQGQLSPLSGQNLQGLKNLTGDVTPGNTALPMAIAGLTGLGMSGRMGAGSRIGGALLSAGIAGLGNYLIRKYANQNRSQPVTQSTQGAQNYSTGDASLEATPSTGTTADQVASNWATNPFNAPYNPLEDIAAIDAEGGYARGGDVHEDAAQDRRQMLGILREKKLIRKARGGFATDAEAPPLPMKKGKSPLIRKPPKHGVPAIAIIITAGKKPPGKEAGRKKNTGGKIELSESQLDKSARKPRAVPPKHGPGNGDQYAPYKKGGHVQVPRGSGKAIRGRSFSGIY